MKIGVLHQLPLEYYPPIANALEYFSQSADVCVQVISSENEKGREPYCNPRIEIRRLRFARRGDRLPVRWRNALAWHWQAARALKQFQPDVILYYEPHSALAVYLYYFWFGGTARLFIHHHEYYTPQDYRQPGNRLTRLSHFVEKQFLYSRAAWISQTNSDRLRFFQADHPKIRPEQLHVFANYPPASWGQRKEHSSRSRLEGESPLRLVYVGSVSLHDTYIGPLVEWLVAHPEAQVQLDVFAYNCDSATADFLRKASGDVVRFHEAGVAYQDLPQLLRKFDVGVILYRCNTINFQYNASNKLFEYLTCGLDVWYPGTMLGVKPFARSEFYPRVVEVDFENMDLLDLAKMRTRNGLLESPWRESCEGELAKLEAVMREGSKRGE
jgi:hypothetical protein